MPFSKVLLDLLTNFLASILVWLLTETYRAPVVSILSGIVLLIVWRVAVPPRARKIMELVKVVAQGSLLASLCLLPLAFFVRQDPSTVMEEVFLTAAMAAPPPVSVGARLVSAKRPPTYTASPVPVSLTPTSTPKPNTTPTPTAIPGVTPIVTVTPSVMPTVMIVSHPTPTSRPAPPCFGEGMFFFESPINGGEYPYQQQVVVTIRIRDLSEVEAFYKAYSILFTERGPFYPLDSWRNVNSDSSKSSITFDDSRRELSMFDNVIETKWNPPRRGTFWFSVLLYERNRFQDTRERLATCAVKIQVK